MTSITEDFFAMAQKLRHQRSVIITNHKHHVRFPCLDILHALNDEDPCYVQAVA
ncbi:hypothetical protein ACQP3L_05265 [Escherichia coli]|nr:hypothetical protein [Escherichia coli]MCV5144698.1 hypothetical protein [Escherichia coli]MCV5159249.1 hypothetical protein [Escherichia coli]MCV5165427.1 hypothetical protein [Escherichia coli]